MLNRFYSSLSLIVGNLPYTLTCWWIPFQDIKSILVYVLMTYWIIKERIRKQVLLIFVWKCWCVRSQNVFTSIFKISKYLFLTLIP